MKLNEEEQAEFNKRLTHYPTEATRETVRLHAMVGTRQEIIADVLRIDPKTLRKNYREELDQSGATATANVGGALYNKAMQGDTSAQIFWMKSKGGWRTTDNVNLSNDSGDLEPPSEIRLVAPSSERDENG